MNIKITIEGLPGSGKSLIGGIIKDLFEKKGVTVKQIHEGTTVTPSDISDNEIVIFEKFKVSRKDAKNFSHNFQFAEKFLKVSKKP